MNPQLISRFLESPRSAGAGRGARAALRRPDAGQPTVAALAPAAASATITPSLTLNQSAGTAAGSTTRP